ncbi:MAG: glycoside hydrolase family 27 protein [Acidimicrobiales bacterium]
MATKKIVGIALALTALVGACGTGEDNGDRPATTAPASSSTTEPANSDGPDAETLAATPPMGWNSWNQVRCYDLNEDVVKRAADAIVRHGLDDLGYRYVVVDDCWQAPERNSEGALVPDPERFSSGLADLADYIHDKGLRFGLYLSPGSETCAMQWDDYPATGLGSLGHERQDAEMLADIGVDYLKYDWCGADEVDGLEPETAFAHMRDELKRLDRPIVYSISEYGRNEPWKWAPGIANMWRTTSDILPMWASIATIINSQADLHPYAEPGSWNDPDMLQVGNGPLTDVEARSHVGMWAMLAAPLMIGTDLDKVTPGVLAALSNPEVIAIDQDPLGRQARRVRDDAGVQVWVRPLSDGEFAVALLNGGDAPTRVDTDLAEVGIDPGRWKVRDVWAQADGGVVDGALGADLEPHAMALFRLSPM